MKKNGDSVRDWRERSFRRFLNRTSLMVTLGVLGLYLICCLFYWYAEFGGPKGTAFYNVLLWNTATLFGQDYADHYPESVGGPVTRNCCIADQHVWCICSYLVIFLVSD